MNSNFPEPGLSRQANFFSTKPTTATTHNHTLRNFFTRKRKPQKDRWQTIALRHSLSTNSREDLLTALRLGSSGCGLWAPSDPALAPLVESALKDPFGMFEGNSGEAREIEERRQNKRTKKIKPPKHTLIYVVFSLTVFLFCLCYGVYAALKSGAWPILGWPVILARGTGLGTLIWTVILFVSMFKGVTSWLFRKFKATFLLENFKLHLLAVFNLVLHAVVHSVAHLARTVPRLISTPFEQLNHVFRCAKPSFRSQTFLEFPKCPLQEHLTFGEICKATVFLTGIALFLVLLVMGGTSSRKIREKNHFAFRVIHKVLIFLWVGLLYLHGAGQFFGSGVALVVPVVGLFFLCFLGLKINEHFFPLKANITKFSFITDQVFKITVTADKKLPNFTRDGSYVLLAVPQISRIDFHPFSVAEFSDCGNSISFAICVRKRWTKRLKALLVAKNSGIYPAKLEEVSVKIPCYFTGPFLSPASAITKLDDGDVSVIIATGVGVTPFLATLKDALKRSLVVYLYWIVRDGREILHAESTLREILGDSRIRLQIHVTQANDADQNDNTFFFSEAVNRSNGIELNLPPDEAPVMTLKLGRPEWVSELETIDEPGTRWVFICASKPATAQVIEAADAISEKSGFAFVINQEEF
jgi:predicted ferric reductase